MKRLAGAILAMVVAATASGARAGEVTLLSVGGNMTGALAPGDRIGSDGNYLDDILVNLTAGQPVKVTLTSKSFDAHLIVFKPSLERLGSDDDSAGGTDAFFAFTPAVSGLYHVGVHGLEKGKGAYRLTVEPGLPTAAEKARAPGPRPIRSLPLRLGDRVSSELEPGDGEDNNSNLKESFTIVAPAGHRLVITLRSGAFDAFLNVYGPDGGKAASDNDGGGGTDARVTLTPARTTTYRISVESLLPPRIGAYVLMVE